MQIYKKSGHLGEEETYIYRITSPPVNREEGPSLNVFRLLTQSSVDCVVYKQNKCICSQF